VPWHVIAALQRGLRADRDARWPSMAALLAELRRDPPRRRRVAIAVGAVLLAAIAIGVLARGRARVDDPLGGDGLDVTRIDVSGYYPTALARVRRMWPDAALVTVRADGVAPDGRADVTHARTDEVKYLFVSPSRVAHAPGHDDDPCEWYVVIRKSEVRMFFRSDCVDDTPIRPPRCTFAQVWQKAIQLGAPATGATARISYAGDATEVWWDFAVGTSLSQILPDDC